MRNFVTQLRKKPAHIKERIALGSTLVGTLVLVFFWVTVVRYEILPKQNLAKSRSPIQTIGDIFKNTYGGAVASVGSFRDGKVEPTGEGKLIVVPQENIFGSEERKDSQKEDSAILEANQ